jgi:hypothetical protein
LVQWRRSKYTKGVIHIVHSQVDKQQSYLSIVAIILITDHSSQYGTLPSPSAARMSNEQRTDAMDAEMTLTTMTLTPVMLGWDEMR